VLHHRVVTYLPFARFPETAEIDFTDTSLFAHLTAEHAVALSRNDLLVSIDAADEAVAEALHVPVGEKLLTVASTVFDGDDIAVAYGYSHFTPQNSEISFGLHN
jgi:GntR family transcriptional regulator